jgi:hypothetical protein
VAAGFARRHCSSFHITCLCHSERSEESLPNIEIYNVLGEKVYSTNLPQTPKGALSDIDLSEQPNGVYFYRILSENGVLVGEGKLVVEK